MLNKIKKTAEKKSLNYRSRINNSNTTFLIFIIKVFPINSGIILFIEGSLFFIATLFILGAATQRLKRKEDK